MRHTGSPGAIAGHRAPRGWRRLVAVGVAAAATLACSLAGAPPASASQSETVIVTSTGLVSPVTAVLQLGGTILTQYHLIDASDALIPTLMEPGLAAFPGVTLTPD